VSSGVVEVVVFLFGVAPGYVYHRAVSRRVPRDAQSGLREAAELVSAGAFASAVAALAMLGVAQFTSALLQLEDLIGGAAYLERHPWEAIWSGLLTVLLASAVAWSAGTAVAALVARDTRVQGGTVWTRVLTRRFQGRRPFLAVELLDGRVVEGLLLNASTEVDQQLRDLALQPPIAWSTRGGARSHVREGFVVVPGREIRVIQGSYPRLGRMSPPPAVDPSSDTPVLNPTR
jgi:hypothetical protein